MTTSHSTPEQGGTDRSRDPAAADVADRELPYTGAVEIRIHGVSGTPPEDLLDRTSVRQVAGDTIAGFYRPRMAEGMRDHAPGTSSDRGPWLEAYSWGGWTSGGRTRAFWLALFPFAMVNVSQRMVPPSESLSTLGKTPVQQTAPVAAADYRWSEAVTSGVGSLHRAVCGLLRLLALSLTVTFVSGIAQIGVVVIGMRCAREAGCVGLPDAATDWLRRLPSGWQLGIGAVVPILALVVLWILSTKTTRRYEDIDPEPDPDTAVRPDDSKLPLGRRDLWRGSRRVRRLRLIHVHAGSATIVLVIGAALPEPGWSNVLTWWGAVWLAFNAALASWRPRNKAENQMLLPRVNWGIAAAAVVLLVVTLTRADVALADADAAVVRIDWLGQRWWFGQLVVLALVVGGLWLLRGRTPKAERRWHLGGFAAFYFASLGWLVGLLFNAALLILVPTWLFTDGLVFGPGAISTFLDQHPTWFGQSVYASGYGVLVAFGVMVLIVAGYAFSAWLRYRKKWTVDADVAAEECNAENEPRDAARKKQIRLVFWLARRVDYAALMIGLLVIGTFAFMALQLVGHATGIGFLSRIAGRLPPGAAGASSVPTAVAAWGAFLVAAVLVFAIGVTMASYRRPSTRRGVGVIWDLACFWPRDVHPFAPPCYTERIVPEFSKRLAAYVPPDAGQDPPAKAVVIAAHSQGTVISMAVLLAQPPEFRSAQVGLLTCGTVLDRLYARFFPRYFSPMAFAALDQILGGEAAPAAAPAGTAEPSIDPAPAKVARWINLWRFSDYLGGSVPYATARQRHDRADQLPAPLPGWATLENRRLVDPLVGASVGAIMPAPPGRHSNYWRDARFQAAVGDLALMVDPALPTAHPDPPPEREFPSAPATIR